MAIRQVTTVESYADKLDRVSEVSSALRGFDLAKLAHIIRHSSERYLDTETGRSVVVGRHDRQLVMIPFDIKEDVIAPVTVHAIKRQQIRFRVRTGRFTHE